MKKEMSDSLNMFWDQSVRVEIPSAGSPQSALHVFNKNLAVITWNSLAALEKNSATLSQTETILNGQSVSGITIHELMQVKNFGEGARELAEMVGEGAFSLNEETACKLHGSVGKEDALTWGIFRNSSVTIRGIDHYTRTICLFAAQYCMSINAPLAFQLFSSKPEFRNALLLAAEGNDSTELGKMFKESRELQMALESKGLTTEVCVEKKKQEKRWRFRFWK